MARKVKKSLDYFNIDVTFSDSIRLASKEIQGGYGLSLIIELWQKIYGSHGYYMKFDKDSRILFLDYSITKITLDELDFCLKIFFNRNIFNEKLYNDYQILTSDSIQERYIDICISTKRSNIELIKEYLCINLDSFDVEKFNIKSILCNNSENIHIKTDNFGINTEKVHSQCNKYGINDTDSVINTEKSTQSKVKKRKENKSKVNEQNETFSDLQNTCKQKIERYEKTLIEEDLQNIIDHFNPVNIKEPEIRSAMYDFKLNKITSDNPEAPYTYKIYKEWFKKYITDNRAKYVHVPKIRVVSISDELEREDLHSAFKFYWQNEYTLEYIKERIFSGEFPPKIETVHFDNLIKNNLIEVEND